MNFIEKLNQDLEHYHLLKHPFYQIWNMGQLAPETLSLYAQEYYHHVAAFPRYISAIHSDCDNIAHRQVLLGNLKEEEEGVNNHPELWLRFSEGLGCSRQMMQSPAQLPETHSLVDGYFGLVRSGYAKGLGALYAYERQTPAVSVSKIEGLIQHYGVKDIEVLEFFTVHAKADQWHSEECAVLIEALPEGQQQDAYEGAVHGARLLWQFLDGMMQAQESLVTV